MSESDPHPVNPQASAEPHQLPAIPPPQPGDLGVPLPASPWIDGNESRGGFDFTAFLHALRRRWLSGLGYGFLIATTLAALLWFLVPVTYEAVVGFRVYRNREQMLRSGAQRGVHPQEYDIEKQTQAALLKSQFVIQAALQRPGIEQLSIVRDERWPWLGQRKPEERIAWLQRELKVRYQEGSEILNMSMREQNKEELIELLDAISDAYIEEAVVKERQVEMKKLERLKLRQKGLEDEYAGELAKLGELARTYGSSQSENVKLQLDMKLKKLMSLENERIAARRAFNDISDMYQQQQIRMQASAAFQPRDFEIEDMLMQYPEYAAMKSQLVEMEQAMKLRAGQLRSGIGSGGAMQAQVSALKSQMEQFKYEKKGEALQRLRMLTNKDDRELQQELVMLQQQWKLANQRLDDLNTEYDQLAEDLKQMGTFNVDLETIEVKREQIEETLAQINEEIESLSLDIQARPQIQVIYPATVPDESNWVIKYFQIIAAWLLAMAGTVLGLTFWDMKGKRVNNTQEVIDKSDVRVIGSLPLINARRAGGLMPMSETGRRLVEVGLTRSIDSIRTALLYAKTQQPYEIVMVTSALGQEGKTTVASQLAVSFARSGRRTLLIDADVRNPQQHVVLGMPFQQGLCEILRGEVTADDVVQPTPAEGLWSLSAGYRDQNSDQALASSAVGKLFAELRQRFDLIVIDTGPVLTSPDAMLLGQHVDGAVISVCRDVSRLPKVTEACHRLQSVGIQIAGAVVNGAETDLRKSDLQLNSAMPSKKEPQLESV